MNAAYDRSSAHLLDGARLDQTCAGLDLQPSLSLRFARNREESDLSM